MNRRRLPRLALPKNYGSSEFWGRARLQPCRPEPQGKDGMWRQLVDHPEAWPETFSTGMLTFALITGVKNGWLDPAAYGPAARKGWLALVGYIDQNGDVTSVCEGTGKKMISTTTSPAPAEPAISTARPRCYGARRRCCGRDRPPPMRPP